MKKITFLLLLVFSFFGGGITASAQVQLGEALDRSTWSVSASSWCIDSGTTGNVTDIKDGKTNTYWHSNWKGNGGTGIGGSLPEYFIVDLGEVKEISGFGYVPRSGGGNGVCTSYKVYVSKTPFDDVTIPATDASHKDAVKNKTGEVKAGTMSWGSGYKLTDVAFDANVMGRYVLFVTLNSDGDESNKNKWASCSEFYVYKVYNTKAGLSKEIKELQYVVDNSGVNPGQYKAANSAAIATAIAKAKAVLDTEGATMTQYGDALNTLKAETNGLVVVNPLEAGYYMIVSGFKGFEEQQKVEKAMYAKAGAPAWKTLDQKDGSQYWQLKAVEGGFALYNLGREKYISGVGALGDETVLKFDKLTTPGDFNIKKGSDVFHASGHNGGAGNAGDITSWGGNSGTASAWVLRKVNYEDILPLVKEGLTEYVDAQQATVESYHKADPGFLSDISSVTAVINNAKANSSSATTIKAIVDFREALALDVQNALKALTKNPVTEGYYQIVSGLKAFKEKQGVEKAMYASASAPAWGTLNGNDATQYWYLKKVEGGFTAYNVGRETYIAGVGAVSDAAATLTFADLSGYGEFNIKLGANVLHANSHNSGDGAGSNIVNWGGNANSASSWMLRRVEDIEALKPAFAAEARKPIMAAIAKVDVNALNGVNPGQIADPQALDEVKNLVTTSTANANAETNVKALLDMEGTFKTASAALLTQHCNKIDTKKYYRIKNKKYDHYIGWKEGTSNTVKMNDDDKTAVDQIWQFVESNGKFKLLNVNAGTYLANVAGGKENTSGLNAGGADYTVSLSGAPCFEIKDGTKPVQEEVNQNLNWWYDNDGNAKWYLIEATDIEVALNNAGTKSYATTYLPFSVSAAEGAELYTGELNGNVMNLTKSHTGVAAEQGIVLVGESSATKAVLTIGEGKATGKGLVGTLTPKTVEASSVLTLGKSGSEVGFFAFTGTQIGANKAYITKPAGASAVMINFGEVTGIENAVAPEAANAPLYDLSGRRVVKAVKGGLYIQNGKKFIAR